MATKKSTAPAAAQASPVPTHEKPSPALKRLLDEIDTRLSDVDCLLSVMHDSLENTDAEAQAVIDVARERLGTALEAVQYASMGSLERAFLMLEPAHALAHRLTEAGTHETAGGAQ